MTTPVSLLGRKAQLGGLRDVLGSVRFYEGLPPSYPEDAPGGALLGAVLLATPSGVVSATGTLATLTLTCPQVALATASGAIGWVRFVNAAGDGILDVRAGVAEAGHPAVVNVTQAYEGGEIQLTSCVLAQ